jgi:hypothetical protein
VSLVGEAGFGGGDGAVPGDDLVLVALPGVQQFIEEARSVSDARAASEIFTHLASAIVDACRHAGGRVVFPSGGGGSDGMPNRVVAMFPPGRWARSEAGENSAAADDVVSAAQQLWRGWLRRALRLSEQAPLPATPGMPEVQWVCVPSGAGGYAGQWESAQRLLAARRRVRDFPAAEWRQRVLCSVGPRWPAEPIPGGVREHEKASLSGAAWVKRRWRRIQHLDGFPSTASIASAPFRKEVLAALDDEPVLSAVSELTDAARAVIGVTQGGDETRVPGLPDSPGEPAKWFASTAGPWVYADTWQAESLARETKADVSVLRPLADRGRAAARRLSEVMGERGVRPPASHLAVIVQDLDSMGQFLGGAAPGADGSRIEVSAGAHREVSSELRKAGDRQRPLLEDPKVLGLPVYVGGDDLLAFAPASTALAAARSCHDAVPPGLPTASTAVVFFHYHASLRDALAAARGLLEAAKEEIAGKHGLGVGYLRRSGASEVSVQPWGFRDGSGDAIGLFGVFAAGQEYPLSPGLLADLDRDRDELARLSVSAADYYQAELTRLIRRHMSGDPPLAQVAEVAVALGRLGDHEAAKRPAEVPAGAWPQPAARVAVFLRQEAR